MRIALVTDTYAPQVNGVTTVLQRIADSLTATGHDVAVVAPQYPAAAIGYQAWELRLASVKFPPYPAIRMTFPRVRRVRSFLDSFQPEIVHVATEGPVGLMGRGYAQARSIPLVTSFHTQFPQYARHYGLPVLEPLVWRWLEWFHRPARWTHTPGVLVRDELVAHGITQARVWGCGVNVRHFRPDRRDKTWRRGFGIEEDAILVLHVGRLAPEKNLDTLMAAWTVAHQALGRRAVFLIAGDGPRARDIDRAMPWARRLGFLDRDALAILYASSDLCMLTSPTETCGLVALEAMASGIPVVAADAGGFRESVHDGDNGFLIPPQDSLGFAARAVQLAMDARTRRRMGEQARATALTRDVATEDAELLRQYQELIHPNSKTEDAPCAA